jgi:hypothetical protein
MELSKLVNVIEFIEHLFPWDFDVVKSKPCIVDSVEANFDSHVFDENTWHWFHICISNLNKERINSLEFALNESLDKDFSK